MIPAAAGPENYSIALPIADGLCCRWRIFKMRREYDVLYDTIEDGWIMASVPDLPGAVTQGETKEEARANIREVIELLLESYRQHANQQASPRMVRETVSVGDSGDAEDR